MLPTQDFQKVTFNHVTKGRTLATSMADLQTRQGLALVTTPGARHAGAAPHAARAPHAPGVTAPGHATPGAAVRAGDGAGDGVPGGDASSAWPRCAASRA